jgi:hypothetical protein
MLGLTLSYLKVVYNSMDIKHMLCKHSDRTYKMQRFYKRVNGKFVPCAWICPDCGQIKTD